MPIPRDIFDEAHEDVLKRLNSDQFPRFMKSMFYIGMYNSIQNRKAYELPDEIWKEFRLAAEGGVETGWEYVSETKGGKMSGKNRENFIILMKFFVRRTKNFIRMMKFSQFLPTFSVLIHRRKYTGWTGTCMRGSGVIQVTPDDMRVIANNFKIREHWDNRIHMLLLLLLFLLPHMEVHRVSLSASMRRLVWLNLNTSHLNISPCYPHMTL